MNVTSPILTDVVAKVSGFVCMCLEDTARERTVSVQHVRRVQ